MKRYTVLTYSLMLALVGFLVFAEGCNQATIVLNKVPVNSLEVKVVDQNNDPVKGAQIQSSNERKSTTNENGIATIRFGSVGIHTVTVLADNYMPSIFVVTMPADRGETVTRRLTEEVTLTAGMNFAKMNMYPLIFNYMFSSYGYSPQIEQYEEGQSTTWRIFSGNDDTDALVMSKAFLKKMDNGKEWWRVMLTKPDEEKSKYIAEVLFSKNRTSVLRYREKIGDTEIQEKPVSEGWYTEPVSLTEESMQGALEKENVTIEIPKGSFEANLLKFGFAPETYLNIWRATDADVPGDVLKYEVTAEDGIVYRNELKDYQTEGASTMLDSF